MCDSCGCNLPQAQHKDRRNILHSDVVRGKVSERQYKEATRTSVGPDTVAKVKANIRRTERLIAAGKLDPDKKA